MDAILEAKDASLASPWQAESETNHILINN